MSKNEKSLIALCAISALACAHKTKNYANVGIGVVAYNDIFKTKDRLGVIPLPDIAVKYYGLYVISLEAAYEHDFAENFFASAYVRFFDG